MALEKSTWDGTWTNINGQNTYPYRGEEKTVHGSMEYSSHDVNQEVA